MMIIFEKMEKRMYCWQNDGNAMVFGTIFNAVISLIIAAFVKKEENPIRQRQCNRKATDGRYHCCSPV